MTKLLEQAFAIVMRMPSDAQDTIAQAMLSMADLAGLDEIEPYHLPSVMEGMAQADRGEFATDEDVAAAFRRFDR